MAHYRGNTLTAELVGQAIVLGEHFQGLEYQKGLEYEKVKNKEPTER